MGHSSTDLVAVQRLSNMAPSVSVSLFLGGSGGGVFVLLRHTVGSGFGHGSYRIFYCRLSSGFSHFGGSDLAMSTLATVSAWFFFVFLSTLLESFLFVPAVLPARCINALPASLT